MHMWRFTQQPPFLQGSNDFVIPVCIPVLLLSILLCSVAVTILGVAPLIFKFVCFHGCFFDAIIYSRRGFFSLLIDFTDTELF